MTVFRAGCGRTLDGPSDLPEFAYRALEFPECPACVHRLEPDAAPPFCRWLLQKEHPFAALASFKETLPDE